MKKTIAAMVSRWFLRYASSRTFGRKGVWSALFPLSHARRFSSKRKTELPSNTVQLRHTGFTMGSAVLYVTENRNLWQPDL